VGVTYEDHEPPSKPNATWLRIDNGTVPPAGHWRLCVSRMRHMNWYLTRISDMKSLIFTVPSRGNSSEEMFDDIKSGSLQTEEGVRYSRLHRVVLSLQRRLLFHSRGHRFSQETLPFARNPDSFNENVPVSCWMVCVRSIGFYMTS
jgi:hypothetical protein